MELVKRDNSAKIEVMLGDILVFLLAFFWFIEIKIVGRLFLLELVYLVIAVFFILTSVRLSLSPFLKKVLVLLAIWLVALMFSDWYRGTAFTNYARGWAKIFFFGINIFVIYQLCRNNPRRLFIYLLGLALGGIVKPSFFPEPNFVAIQGFWKTGYGFPVTTLALLVASFLGVNFLAVAFGLALLNLGLGYRSNALCCLVGALFYILSRGLDWKKLRQPAAFLRKGMAVVLIVGAFFYYYYDIGVFRSTTINVGQYELEGVAKNPLYGRLDFLVGLMAVWDSPLIGRGSWAGDPRFVTLLEQLYEAVGREDFYEEGTAETQIAGHSYLLGAWVEAGILGPLIWFFLFFQTLKGMIYLFKFRIQPVGLLAFLLSWFLWNILFSPLGAGERITAAFFTVLLNWVLTMGQKTGDEGLESPQGY